VKTLYLILPFLLWSCSSVEKKQEINKVDKFDFSKDKSLKANQFNDFYSSSLRSNQLNFLFDETSALLSDSEIKGLSEESKIIVHISRSCQKPRNENFKVLINKYFNVYQKIPAFWNTIANCHLNVGDFKTALLFYNKALELDDNYYPAFNNLGVFYLRQANYQKALVAFEKANSLAPFAKTPVFNLASIYLKFNLIKFAEPFVDSLFKRFPNEARVVQLMAYLSYAKGDYQSSLTYFTFLTKEKLISATDRLYLAYIHLSLGDKSKSKKILEEISQLSLTENAKMFYRLISSKLQGVT
jgi:tetratricopeptide (TPR) repeat protein